MEYPGYSKFWMEIVYFILLKLLVQDDVDWNYLFAGKESKNKSVHTNAMT